MKPAHIVCILDSNGFPNGMAATQRIKLLSKALVIKGFRVTILCVRALERAPVENTNAKGCHQGIDFEYTSGTTLRAKSFWKRRWLETRGLLISIVRLLQFRKSSSLSLIYLWGTMGSLTFRGCFYRIFARMLKVPLLVELNERPWSLKEKPSFLERRISPLIGTTGVIVISTFLENWALEEEKRISKKVAIGYIPILVDTQETIVAGAPASLSEPVLIFAAAPQYTETIRFLLEAMKTVVKKYPCCRLKITGIRNSDPAAILLRLDQTDKDLQPNIELIGYLSRSDLLALYRQCNALLIPLFNDVTSQARFPTKLGEYLCSGKPVVTNCIGEATNYLKNNYTAFLCEPDDPVAYAETICRVLDDPIRAEEIGLRGREVALKHFDYVLWAEPLSIFLNGLMVHPQP